jgi:hypothetical protein
MPAVVCAPWRDRRNHEDSTRSPGLSRSSTTAATPATGRQWQRRVGRVRYSYWLSARTVPVGSSRRHKSTGPRRRAGVITTRIVLTGTAGSPPRPSPVARLRQVLTPCGKGHAWRHRSPYRAANAAPRMTTVPPRIGEESQKSPRLIEQAGASPPSRRFARGRAFVAGYTRRRYSPVRVSISIRSPVATNSGTWTMWPPVIFAGFRTLPDVSPRTAGSV